MKKLVFLFGLLLSVGYSQCQSKVTTTELNFRSTPDVAGNRIGVIPHGTIVMLEAETIIHQGWSKIKYAGKTGYVSNSYLGEVTPDNPRTNNTSSSPEEKVKYYQNSKGEKVQSPTHYNSVPAGATAECRDGTYSFSRSRSGTCSHHGGVKRWL